MTGEDEKATNPTGVARWRRLRLGEITALAGAGLAIAALTLPWYGGAHGLSGTAGKLDAWDTFGAAVALLIVACVAALTLAVANFLERSPAIPVAAAVWSTVFGIAATIAAIVRVLSQPDGSTSLQVGAWLALAGAVAILLGSWQSMRDERPELYRRATPRHRSLS